MNKMSIFFFLTAALPLSASDSAAREELTSYYSQAYRHLLLRNDRVNLSSALEQLVTYPCSTETDQFEQQGMIKGLIHCAIDLDIVDIHKELSRLKYGLYAYSHLIKAMVSQKNHHVRMITENCQGSREWAIEEQFPVLHLAAALGLTETVKVLLTLGFNQNTENGSGQTAAEMLNSLKAIQIYYDAVEFIRRECAAHVNEAPEDLSKKHAEIYTLLGGKSPFRPGSVS